jgi:sugar lactone lactonase YvrE
MSRVCQSETKTMRLEPVMTGLTFPEGPRWRNGKLWFSDFYSHAVYSVDLAGICEKMLDVPNQPSGLGWLPNGDLLVVSMKDRKVMRWDGASLSIHADLGHLASFHCNDMIVLSSGSAFVGNFGFDPHDQEPCSTNLIRVAANGSVGVAARNMAFPNGMVTLNDETILVVAESVGQCLTAFDIESDGSLSNRRLFAQTTGSQPDGICLDGGGNILVATMVSNSLAVFAPDGRHLATHGFDVPVWACAVSETGEILLCTSHHSMETDCQRERSGAIQRLVA